MVNNTKKSTSWGWIVFWFILFWPVGVYLLIKKLSVDKSAMMKSSKTLFIVSYILMGIGAIYLIMAFAEDPNMITAAIVFGSPGVWLFFKAKKTKVTGERYKKYIALVVNQKQTSIDSIAPAAGVSYEVAVKDLQKMIDTGYFFGAYIDATQRVIVLANTTSQQISQAAYTTQVQEKVATCGSCGANNRVIVGQVAECEYCASPLQ
ncbi:MAG: hypothetical protein FWH52_00905 [Synergistaceae bacterium]|nr:hypothetical protein [Synergistaceae bacterium]